MIAFDLALVQTQTVCAKGGIDLNLAFLETDFAIANLEFFHLHLQHRVLCLLLCLGLCRLRLVLLQHLLGSLCKHARQGNLDLWWQLLFFGRQGHAQLLLDLLAVLEAHMVGDVRLHGGHHLLRLGVLTDQLHDEWVLHHRLVHSDVR